MQKKRINIKKLKKYGIKIKKQHRFDPGALIFVVGLLAYVFILLFITTYRPIYDTEQLDELLWLGTSQGGEDIGLILIEDGYKSEYLTIPESHTVVTSRGSEKTETVHQVVFIDVYALSKTKILHVRVPDTVTYFLDADHVNPHSAEKVTLYLDNPELRDAASALGFTIGTTAEYDAMFGEVSTTAPTFDVLKTRFIEGMTKIVNSFWSFVALVLSPLLIMWIAVEKSNAVYPDDSDGGEEKFSFTYLCEVIHTLATFIAMYLVFFGILAFVGGDLGIATESVFALIFNWPLKIFIGLYAILFVIDLFRKCFFPWFFNRVLVTCLFGIGAALAAGALGVLGTYVHHIFVQLPLAGYLIIAIFAVAVAVLTAADAIGMGGFFQLGGELLDSTMEFITCQLESNLVYDDDGNAHSMSITPNGVKANNTIIDYDPLAFEVEGTIIKGQDGKYYTKKKQ